MMDEFVERFRHRLLHRGLSMKAASLEAGLNETFVRDMLLRGKVPTIEKLIKLARVLGTTVSDLIGEQEALFDSTSVPLINTVSAGALMSSDLVDETLKMLVFTELEPGDWVALRVDGDSMDRISPPDSIILVNRRDKRLVPNACYVIANQFGEASYKRFRPGPPVRFEPVSTNPAHEPIFPDNDVPVIGRVKRTMLDM